MYFLTNWNLSQLPPASTKMVNLKIQNDNSLKLYPKLYPSLLPRLCLYTNMTSEIGIFSFYLFTRINVYQFRNGRWDISTEINKSPDVVSCGLRKTLTLTYTFTSIHFSSLPWWNSFFCSRGFPFWWGFPFVVVVIFNTFKSK